MPHDALLSLPGQAAGTDREFVDVLLKQLYRLPMDPPEDFILFFRSGRCHARQLTIYRSSVQIALPYHPSLAGSTARARAKTRAKTMEAMAQGLDDDS